MNNKLGESLGNTVNLIRKLKDLHKENPLLKRTNCVIGSGNIPPMSEEQRQAELDRLNHIETAIEKNYIVVDTNNFWSDSFKTNSEEHAVMLFNKIIKELKGNGHNPEVVYLLETKEIKRVEL